MYIKFGTFLLEVKSNRNFVFAEFWVPHSLLHPEFSFEISVLNIDYFTAFFAKHFFSANADKQFLRDFTRQTRSFRIIIIESIEIQRTESWVELLSFLFLLYIISPHEYISFFPHRVSINLLFLSSCDSCSCVTATAIEKFVYIELTSGIEVNFHILVNALMRIELLSDKGNISTFRLWNYIFKISQPQSLCQHKWWYQSLFKNDMQTTIASLRKQLKEIKRLANAVANDGIRAVWSHHILFDDPNNLLKSIWELDDQEVKSKQK